MKSSWFLLLVFVGAILAGCTGEASTPQDDAFQKQLAEAAEKNKGKASAAPMKRGQLPPEVKNGVPKDAASKDKPDASSGANN